MSVLSHRALSQTCTCSHTRRHHGDPRGLGACTVCKCKEFFFTGRYTERPCPRGFLCVHDPKCPGCV